jgi:hypothetical protein
VFRARLMTLIVGAAATALAVLAAGYALAQGRTIFDMLPRMYNMFLAPLSVMFMVGLFFRRATAGVALSVALLTQLFSLVWSWWSEVPGLFRSLGLDAAAAWWTSLLGTTPDGQIRSPTILLAIAAPALFGLVLGAIASFLCGRDDHPGAQFTRREIMKRPLPEHPVAAGE